MALIVRFENLTETLDIYMNVLLAILDFQKAFDIVNHSILPDKLHIYRTRGIGHEWFINYQLDHT